MSVSTGLISGIDYSTMITQLMQVEANPQTLLKQQLSATQAQGAAYRAINTRFAALQTAAAALQDPTAWTASKAASSSTSVTATAGAAATPGSLTFTVDSLATSHSVISDQKWTATGTQTPADLDYGATTLDITVGGTTTSLALDRDGNGTATLAEAAAAINAKTELGLSATAVQTAPGVYQLQVTSKKTGEATFTVGATDTFDVVTQGSNATLTVGTGPGKYTATSTTNTFSGLLPDTTITVSGLADSVTVSVASDPDAVASKVKNLVDAANGALESINAYTSKDSTTATLQGDSTLRALASQIVSTIAYAAGGDTASVAGLELNRTGTFTFDAKAFTEKFTSDPALVSRIFTGTAAGKGADGVLDTADDAVSALGFAGKLKALAKAASDSASGSLTLLGTSSDTAVKDLQSRIEAWDTRLAMRKDSLTRQFTAMETALGTLQNQGNWLASQLAGLPSWSSSK
ncbi:flagellar filament capping protein FliD [Modestobacter sp. VKM Ac-2977]|uniref:flagellar filament capping protein FliD n=1 Tax=Modestobacter sp. VKM Ac-2977 TaxID=3004131 RepID=UPI0022AA907B|nr:flagellar filament capping protein FliD [Modestobacter sp. VKM Ac-2977]MCZ2819180.1 flagellar filament capping protein FliD [Modestobacter sp. VKM Ac-2977]